MKGATDEFMQQYPSNESFKMHTNLALASLSYLSLAHGWQILFFSSEDTGCTNAASIIEGNATISCQLVPAGIAFASIDGGPFTSGVYTDDVCTQSIFDGLNIDCTPVSEGNYVFIEFEASDEPPPA